MLAPPPPTPVPPAYAPIGTPAPPASPGYPAPPGTPAWGTAPPPAAWGHVPATTVGSSKLKSGGAGKVVGIVIGAVVFLAIVGAVAFVFLSGSDDTTAVSTLQGTWESVTSKSGHYSLDMPSGATFSSEPLDLPNGIKIQMETIYSGDGTIDTANVGLIYLEEDLGPAGLPAETLASNFDQSLEGMATGAVKSRGGTVTGTTRVDSELGPAGRFSGKLPKDGYVMEGFGVLHGTTLVAVMAIVPDDQAAVADTTVDRAVKSLTAR